MQNEGGEGINSLARCSHIIGHALVVEHIPQVARLLLAASLPALLHAPLTATSLLLLLPLLPTKYPLPFLLLAAVPGRRSSCLKLISPVCST